MVPGEPLAGANPLRLPSMLPRVDEELLRYTEARSLVHGDMVHEYPGDSRQFFDIVDAVLIRLDEDNSGASGLFHSSEVPQSVQCGLGCARLEDHQGIDVLLAHLSRVSPTPSNSVRTIASSPRPRTREVQLEMTAHPVTASAAALLVVLFPVIVAGQSRSLTPAEQAPAVAETPAPQEASLTIHLTAPGHGHAKNVPPFTVLAIGPPPTQSIPLRSEDGAVVATATASRGACTGSAPTFDTALAAAATEQSWCVKIGPLSSGVDVTGTLSGPEGVTDTTALSLMVGVRDNWWWLPFLIALAGFGVAILITLWPNVLRSLVKGALLSRILKSNRSAGTEGIQGLDAWVRNRLAAGKSSADLLPIVTAAVETGPLRVKDGRKDLQVAIQNAQGNSSIGAHHPYLIAAASQAADRPVTADDVLNLDGTARDELPTSSWSKGLDDLVARAGQLEKLTEAVAGLPALCQSKGNAIADAARMAFGRISTPDDFERFDQILNQAWSKLFTLQSDPECAPGMAARIGESPPSPIEAEPRKLNLVPSSFRSSLGAAGFLFFLTLGVVVAFAFVTLFVSNYLSVPSFGLKTDYWQLFVAAIGSTLAATILTMFGFWSVNEEQND
jgi:uncharacterized membrane protein